MRFRKSNYPLSSEDINIERNNKWVYSQGHLAAEFSLFKWEKEQAYRKKNGYILHTIKQKKFCFGISTYTWCSQRAQFIYGRQNVKISNDALFDNDNHTWTALSVGCSKGFIATQ